MPDDPRPNEPSTPAWPMPRPSPGTPAPPAPPPTVAVPPTQAVPPGGGAPVIGPPPAATTAFAPGGGAPPPPQPPPGGGGWGGAVPPQQPPGPGGWGPPPGPPPKRGPGLTLGLVAIGIFLLIGLVIAALIVVSGGGDDSAAEEVFLEPIATAHDPFTDPTGDDESISAVPVSTGGSSSGGSSSGGSGSIAVASKVGGEPGLYGGTRNISSCDRAKLVDFLESEPVKARAWADVLGVEVSDIRSYVDTLTPMLLRSDTRVTNHGFKDGEATDIQAVLQAGTAVLADRLGQPVVKCYCGNPLTPPRAARQRYIGDRWDDFDETNIQLVVVNRVEITTFVIVDVTTNITFVRPAGTDGGDDRDPPEGTPTPTTVPTTSPPSTSPPSTSPPSTSPPSTSPPSTAPATDAIEGTYAFTGEVGPGSNGNCTAYDGTFTISADGNALTIAVEGGAFTGTINDDLSFDVSAPLSSGVGTETLHGQFDTSTDPVTLSGNSEIEGGGIYCNILFTATKTG